MKKVLVTYATLAGSTAEVARVVAEELATAGWEVEVAPLGEVTQVEGYAGVVVGGPMIMGWHRGALAFLRRHRRAWRQVPVAVFVTAMSLTDTGRAEAGASEVMVDPQLPKPPAQAGRLSFRERYATLSNYLRPILRAVQPARPASLGVFGGRLEYGRLPWWAVVFAMVIVQAPAGERRNWAAIRKWAAGLPAALKLTPERAAPHREFA
jgi:menaquinone-dependent protoporphyrinogen oxidase